MHFSQITVPITPPPHWSLSEKRSDPLLARAGSQKKTWKNRLLQCRLTIAKGSAPFSDRLFEELCRRVVSGGLHSWDRYLASLWSEKMLRLASVPQRPRRPRTPASAAPEESCRYVQQTIREQLLAIANRHCGRSSRSWRFDRRDRSREFRRGRRLGKHDHVTDRVSACGIECGSPRMCIVVSMFLSSITWRALTSASQTASADQLHRNMPIRAGMLDAPFSDRLFEELCSARRQRRLAFMGSLSGVIVVGEDAATRLGSPSLVVMFSRRSGSNC